ncbi:hypothetical protein C0995_000147 [Termitomyces sp. Mi166|nr:hypothetical protein C0995_000147 [Termitomyces sp. Mi166\
MFVAPSAQGRSGFHSAETQDSSRREYGFNGARGGPCSSSGNTFTNSHPYSSSLADSDGPDPFHSRSTSHGHDRPVESLDPQHRKQSAVYEDISYALGRDVSPYGDYRLFPSSGTSLLRQDSARTDTRSGLEQGHSEPSSSAAPPKRKSRREKPRIELAPDQPPTTQGKPRARVYVAFCHNCSKRTNGNNECDYDAVPKRRGPDKTPGGRQRILKNSTEDGEVGPVRRRRRGDIGSRGTTSPGSRPPPDSHQPSRTGSNTSPVPAVVLLPSPQSDILYTPVDFAPVREESRAPAVFAATSHNSFDDSAVIGLFDKAPTAYDTSFDLSTILPLNPLHNHGISSNAYITSLDESNSEEDEYSGVSCEPSANFTRKIWWESLLSLYISPDPSHRQNLTVAERASAAQGITSDIRFLFNTSNYWFSFFHIPTFNSNYLDPVRRERMQPSLVLALLAMSIFWQSSEVGLGQLGRERALRFRDEAQSALDASFNAGWIDETLAQAAWLLALFEVCAHPLHSSERSNSSLIMLDSIIRSLSLTFVDADNPKTTKFSPGAVPAVFDPSQNEWLFSEEDFNPHMPPNNAKLPRELASEPGCSCRSLTLITHQQESSEQTPLWTLTPAWSDRWNEAEIRKESCRRLCWSSMILAAGHVSYTTAHRSGILKLFISDPANYALLFSGESIAYSPALSSTHSSKDTIWALHDHDVKAHFAIKAWLEADVIEAALNKHTCRIERQFIFQAREYIFKYLGECRYIEIVPRTIKPRMTSALGLWECDNTLTVAMDVCKAFLPALDYLTALWPCPEQRSRYENLRERLVKACYLAGVSPPPPPNLRIPLSSPALSI